MFATVFVLMVQKVRTRRRSLYGTLPSVCGSAEEPEDCRLSVSDPDRRNISRRSRCCGCAPSRRSGSRRSTVMVRRMLLVANRMLRRINSPQLMFANRSRTVVITSGHQLELANAKKHILMC